MLWVIRQFQCPIEKRDRCTKNMSDQSPSRHFDLARRKANAARHHSLAAETTDGLDRPRVLRRRHQIAQQLHRVHSLLRRPEQQSLASRHASGSAAPLGFLCVRTLLQRWPLVDIRIYPSASIGLCYEKRTTLFQFSCL